MKSESMTVELMVRSVEASIDFYKNVLSFKLVAVETEKGKPYWAKMEFRGSMVSFKEENRLKSEVEFMKDKSIGGSFTICLIVDDLEAYYEQVSAKCKLRDHVHLTPCGAYQFMVQDNNDYILTFQRF